MRLLRDPAKISSGRRLRSLPTCQTGAWDSASPAGGAIGQAATGGSLLGALGWESSAGLWSELGLCLGLWGHPDSWGDGEAVAAACRQVRCPPGCLPEPAEPAVGKEGSQVSGPQTHPLLHHSSCVTSAGYFAYPILVSLL